MKRLVAVMAVAAGVAAWTSVLRAAPALESFYVVRHYFSDVNSPFTTFADVVEVAQQGDDVRVRDIALSGLQTGCAGTFVRAAERVRRHAAVGSIAGQNLCALNDKRIHAALAGAVDDRLISFAGYWTSIVATCAGRETAVELPNDDSVHWDLVSHNDPGVADASKLLDNVLKKTGFTETAETFDTWIDPPPADQAVARRVIADLQSGRFRAGFKDLTRPFLTSPGPAFPMANLLDQGELKFDKYEVVNIPPAALFDHITGEVHLRLTVQSTSGFVTDIAVVSGDPVLVYAAMPAVREWRFTPGSVTANPVDIRLQFPSQCPK